MAINGTLKINDITFNVDPTSIRHSENALNHSFDALRSATAFKTRTGHGDIQFTIDLYFGEVISTDHGYVSAVNDFGNLAKLAFQFRKVPFCFVENELIRTVVPVDSDKNIACAMNGLVIRPGGQIGLINSLMATLRLIWFNYKPYSTNFYFRKTFNSSQPHEPKNKFLLDSIATYKQFASTSSVVLSDWIHSLRRGVPQLYNETALGDSCSDPGQSYAFKAFYSTSMGKKLEDFSIGNLDDEIRFLFDIYREITPPPQGEAAPFALNAENISAVYTPDISSAGENVDLRIHDNILQDLVNLARDFRNNTGKSLPILSMFRTNSEQRKIKARRGSLANEPGTSAHEAGMAFDVLLDSYIKYKDTTQTASYNELPSGVQSDLRTTFGSKTADESIELPNTLSFQSGFGGLTLSEWRDLIELGKRHGFRSAVPTYGLAESWHFTSDKFGALIDKYGAKEKAIQSVQTSVEVSGVASNLRRRQSQLMSSENQDINNVSDFGLGERLNQDTNDHSEKRKMEDWVFYEEKDGYKLVKDDNGFYVAKKKTDSFTIRSGLETGGVVLRGVISDLQNGFALLPLLGQTYSTLQYTGGVDARIILSLLCVGESGRSQLQQLMKLVHAQQDNAIRFRELVKQNGISVINDIAKIAGIESVIFENIEVSTVDGSPDTLDVTITMSEAGSTLKDKIAAKLARSAMPLIRKLITRLVESSKITKVPITRSLDIPVSNLAQINSIEVLNRETQQAGISSILNLIYFFKVEKKGDSAKEKSLILLANEFVKILNNLPLFPLVDEKWGLREAFGLNILTNSQLAMLFNNDEAKKEYRNILAELDSKMNNFVHIQLLKTLIDIGDPQIKEDFAAFELSNKIVGSLAYPDLDLPPNPISNSIFDTEPDFYFYNVSDVELNDPSLLRREYSGPLGEMFDRSLILLRNSYHSFGRDVLQGGAGKFYDPGLFNTDRTAYKASLTPPTDYPNVRRQINEAKHKTDTDTYFVDNFSSDGETSNKLFMNQIFKSVNDGKALEDFRHFDTVPEGAPLSQRLNLQELEDIFSIKFRRDFYDESLTMRRAFPTFKIFLMEERSMDADVWKAYDDFYDINSIQEIRTISDEENPVSLCIIQIANIGGNLLNKKFPTVKGDFGSIEDPSAGIEAIVRSNAEKLQKTNPFENTIIKDGTRVQVRLGYSNNPENLPVVFNGQIASIEGTDLITIVCQGDGAELVQQEDKGALEDSEKFYTFNADTNDLLSTLICSPEAKHFGRYTLTNVTDRFFAGSYKKLRPDGVVDTKWGFEASPADDNIFVEPRENYWNWWDQLSDGIILPYNAKGLTIWDVFKEMELRHPGWIAAVVPYETRSTIFFGIPTMSYFYRDTKGLNELLLRQTVEIYRQIVPTVIRFVDSKYETDELGAIPDIINTIELIRSGYDPFPKLPPSPGSYDPTKVDTLKAVSEFDPDKLKLLSSIASSFVKRANDVHASQSKAEKAFTDYRVKPFQNWHLVTSEFDIIANEIQPDYRDTYNAVRVYYTHDTDIIKEGADLSSRSPNDTLFGEDNRARSQYVPHKSIRVKLDESIDESHIREMTVAEFNCASEDMALRYGIGHLLRSLKGLYKGQLTVLGRPKIKPHDMIWIMDTYNDMVGPVYVRRVVHTLSKETGFITEITPGLHVTHNEYSTTGLGDATGIFLTEFALGLIDKAGGGIGAVGAAGAAAGTATLVALNAPIITAGSIAIALAGGLKILRAATGANPVIINPLYRNGKPYVQGLDTFEIEGLVSHINGVWSQWVQDFESGKLAAFASIDAARRSIRANI